MTVRIVGATLRDLSYVAANLRPDDYAEVNAQFDAWSPALIAALALRDHAYIAMLDANPEAAFGAGRAGTHSGHWIAWSYGTARMRRCVPLVTAFVREVIVPAIYEAGGQRVEARALASNTMARRWLKRLGAVEDCTLKSYGRNGEDFLLFSWARADHMNTTGR